SAIIQGFDDQTGAKFSASLRLTILRGADGTRSSTDESTMKKPRLMRHSLITWQLHWRRSQNRARRSSSGCTQDRLAADLHQGLRAPPVASPSVTGSNGEGTQASFG